MRLGQFVGMKFRHILLAPYPWDVAREGAMLPRRGCWIFSSYNMRKVFLVDSTARHCTNFFRSFVCSLKQSTQWTISKSDETIRLDVKYGEIEIEERRVNASTIGYWWHTTLATASMFNQKRKMNLPTLELVEIPRYLGTYSQFELFLSRVNLGSILQHFWGIHACS